MEKASGPTGRLTPGVPGLGDLACPAPGPLLLAVILGVPRPQASQEKGSVISGAGGSPLPTAMWGPREPSFPRGDGRGGLYC